MKNIPQKLSENNLIAFFLHLQKIVAKISYIFSHELCGRYLEIRSISMVN